MASYPSWIPAAGTCVLRVREDDVMPQFGPPPNSWIGSSLESGTRVLDHVVILRHLQRLAQSTGWSSNYASLPYLLYSGQSTPATSEGVPVRMGRRMGRQMDVARGAQCIPPKRKYHRPDLEEIH